MDLFAAISEGKFEHYGVPGKITETLLSHLFFFDNYVLKLYKHKKAFYGDLSDFTFRKEFYAEDFFWNNAFAPEIYLELIGVKNLSPISFDEGDDFLIKMKLIDDTQNLTNLLQQNKISVEDMAAMTAALTKKLRFLTKKRKDKLDYLFQRGWLSLQTDDLDDLQQWAYLAAEHIPKDTTDALVTLLKTYAKSEEYFINHDRALLSVAIDNNCDNLLFLHSKPSFIDIMTPKENWRVSDEYFNVVRTAVDGYTLGNKALGDIVYATYSKYRNLPSKKVTLIYEIRSALIQWSYRHLINQHAVAEKFRDFTLEKAEELRIIGN